MEKIKTWFEMNLPRLEIPGRPVVTLSYAQSLDGCLAFRRGQPFGLSGPESMKLTHILRAAHDAILVGIGTVQADNPRLTVRLVGGHDPRPVILDTHLRMPLDCRLFQRSENLPWVACGLNPDEEKLQALEARNARIIRCQVNERKRVDLADLLRRLGESGIRSVMVEGGAGVITSFLAAGLVDLAMVTIAPIWLGGLHVLEEKAEIVWRNVIIDPEIIQLGKDTVIWGKVDFKLI
jgi:GTP cyclohydrolase II